MIRSVEPEWLDELRAQDPRALRARRDLRRINTLMGNASIIARELRRLHIKSIAEIGAGSGTLLLGCTKEDPVEATLVDRRSVVSRETLGQYQARGWSARAVEADVFDWLAEPREARFDAIVANLFLHHFEPGRLGLLLSLAARETRAFIACEPRRSAMALVGAHLLGAIGCNDVSRHDAVVSVRAGFSGRELSALWPEGWKLEEGPRGLFSHVFVARRP
jgi:hypothetical protein